MENVAVCWVLGIRVRIQVVMKMPSKFASGFVLIFCFGFVQPSSIVLLLSVRLSILKGLVGFGRSESRSNILDGLGNALREVLTCQL